MPAARSAPTRSAPARAAAPPATAPPAPAPKRTRITVLLVAVAVGTLVSVGLGVYGRMHEPVGNALNVAGFSSGLAAKTWVATGAIVLVLLQLITAVIMYRTGASWLAGVHRWMGRVAILATVPVAVHCLYALGFDSGSPRVLAHSLAGCFVYGAFVAKMLVLQRDGAPRWSIPLLGGLLFTALTGVWLTSALWFFTTRGFVF